MRLPLTVLESADLLGRYRYVELAGFRLLGPRALRCSAPEVVGYIAAASRAHAYRAALFESRLPVSVGLPDVATCTRSPGPKTDAALELAVGDGPDAVLLDLLLNGVYPAMLTSYGERLAVVSPPADGGLARALRRAIADLEMIREEGIALGQAPAASAESSQRLAELLLLGAGPFGPIRSGDDSRLT